MQEENRSLKEKLTLWAVGQVASRLLRLLFGTYRLEVLSPGLWERYLEGGRKCIGVTWHRGALFCLYLFGPYRPAIMISRSKDGDYLARFTTRMGGLPVRGSSSQGGAAALKEMLRLIRRGQTRFGATVADGPQGPAFQAKKGMITLSQLSGLPLIPVMWSADRAWVFEKAWDKTMIPKPFSRVVIKTGREMAFPPRLSEAEMERARRELEDELNGLRDELDRRMGRIPN